MPRRLLGVFMLLLVSVLVGRAQGDVVFLIVGPDTVTRNEFEYHYRKTSDQSRPDFVRKLASFKQKVQVAKMLGLDTLQNYRMEKELYCGLLDKQASRFVMGDQTMKHRPSTKEWIKLVHLTYPLNQRADKHEERKAVETMDSLYRSLTEMGGDVQPEVLPWMQTRHLLNEWQNQLRALDKGEFSKPFFSPQGIHIIAWTDKREEATSISNHRLTDRPYLLREVEEGLLVTSLDGYLERTMVCTASELEDYFDRHRESFGWGTPHFKGAVVHCQSKAEAKRIKKFLKKYPEDLWGEAAQRMPADVSGGCRIETGLFAIGSNPYVDKLVFKCGDFETMDGYPYTWVLGKKMKKGPGAYTDVREKVEKQYKKDKKKADLEALMGKISVEIDEEVLKTVNHEGIK